MRELYVKMIETRTEFCCLRDNWGLFMTMCGKDAEGAIPLVLVNERPVLKDGEVMAYRCELKDGRMLRTYLPVTREESLKPMYNPPRKWTRLSVKRTLEASGLWDEAKEAIVGLGLWDEFLMCDFISESDSSFKSAYALACEKFGKDRVDAIIDIIPVEK